MASKPKSVWILLVTMIFIVTGTPAPQAAAQAVPPPGSLMGQILDPIGNPRPGLLVSLVHPSIGRSSPRFTNEQGVFFFEYVPPHPTPYYLEVYWGRQLIFSQAMVINGFIHLPPLRL